jgi:anti-sigma factor RsiW
MPSAIDCETTVRRLWDYIDSGLTSLSGEEVETHLATCALCARRFAFARVMKDELGKLSSASLWNIDETARADLSSRIRASLRGTRDR